MCLLINIHNLCGRGHRNRKRITDLGCWRWHPERSGWT